MDDTPRTTAEEKSQRFYERCARVGHIALQDKPSPQNPPATYPNLHLTPVLRATHKPVTQKLRNRLLPAAFTAAAILLISTGIFAFKSASPAQRPLGDTVISKETKDTLPDRVAQPKVTPPTDNNSHKATSPPPATLTLQAYSDQIAAAKNLTEVKQALSAFGTKYGLTISLNPPPSLYGGFTFTPLSEANLDNTKTVGQVFVKEWSKYPPDWLHTSKSPTNPTIVFTAQVRDASGVNRGGVYDNGTTIYFDVLTMLSVVDSSYSYARATIHHEAAHYAQAAIDGTVYYQDPVWLSYNPSGFLYGTPTGGDYYHPLPGFVSQYSKTNIAEDKAEIFSFIMTDQYRPALLSWLPGDSNLGNKVQAMKQTMCAQWTTMCGAYYDTLQ